MEPNILETLPPELIFHILDFLGPVEMSAFPCTCQHALSLVNQKIDTPDGRERYPLEFYTS